MTVGHSREDLQFLMDKIGATSVDDVLRYLGGKPTQGQVMSGMEKTLNDVTFKKLPTKVGRFAGSSIGRGIARVIPGLALLGNVTDAADIVAGDDSLGNKAMDATAMVVGGTAGALLGGPLGASFGASAGKMLSDGTQFLFGGGKSPEERRMEEALAMLQSRGLV